MVVLYSLSRFIIDLIIVFINPPNFVALSKIVVSLLAISMKKADATELPNSSDIFKTFSFKLSLKKSNSQK
ncbi:MAG: hypothetical protein QXD60_00675 [Nanopusillaceae archaeon]